MMDVCLMDVDSKIPNLVRLLDDNILADADEFCRDCEQLHDAGVKVMEHRFLPDCGCNAGNPAFMREEEGVPSGCDIKLTC